MTNTHESAEFLQNPTRLARKVKQLRTKYAAAVRAGKRSGGGRHVYTFYEQCQAVFGGNAAADEIPGGIETNHGSFGAVSSTMAEKEIMVESLEQTATTPCNGGSLGDEFTLENSEPTKRRHLIANLRDQKLKKKITNDQQMINIALKKLVLQEQMIKKICESNNQQANAIEFPILKQYGPGTLVHMFSFCDGIFSIFCLITCYLKLLIVFYLLILELQ